MPDFVARLERLAGIASLPAHAMTYAVVAIWLAGAAGWEPAARFWRENAASVTAFVQLGLGIWLAYRAVAGRRKDQR